MASILTEHVRHFGTPAADNGFLDVVRRILRSAMRRLGLLGRPPSQLGYADVRTWRDDGAFDDVTQDCYLSAVVARIAGLRRSLQPDRDVDPLIYRNVARFLAERQREHNPIGYSAFQNVRAAVTLAQEAGWLAVERPPRRPVSHSLLLIGGAAGAAVTADWLGEWLGSRPGLRRIGLALSRCSQEAQAWLFERLEELRGAVAGPVRLGDLVAVLERQARQAWPASAPPPSATVADVGEDEEVVVVRIVPADVSVEDRDHYRGLIARAERALRELPQQPRLLERRLRLLEAVLRQVESTDGATLRQVELARELGLEQAVIFRDLEVIREIVARVSAQMKN
jgi:hypothetical protein